MSNRLRIDIITIFPKMFGPVLNESIIKRAQKKRKVEIYIHNLRDYSCDKHKKVDDRPFGGGSGMVMRPEPIFEAVGDIKSKIQNPKSKTILLCPQGKRLNQEIAKRIAKYKHLILICGHYEGVDERVRRHLVDEEISIGDYVLTGGELPAMILVDSLVRLIPGVLKKEDATKNESFGKFPILEYPQYTRPADYKGWKVPKVLLSGNHAEIEKWRSQAALRITKKVRPDLLKSILDG